MQKTRKKIMVPMSMERLGRILNLWARGAKVVNIKVSDGKEWGRIKFRRPTLEITFESKD